MISLETIRPPEGFEWQHWVDRWDRMQDHYLARRAERFGVLVRTVRDTQASVSRVLDLGCGTGSLVLALLESFPRAEVFGVDFDPTMLLLAGKRLVAFGGRVRFLQTDLRDESWSEGLPAPFDAVVSATALHWLAPDRLTSLYHQVARLLRPGGILLNADHVGSDFLPIQRSWERHRRDIRRRTPGACDDWDGFWDAYARALGLDVREVHQRVPGGWKGGVEEGLPLPWHLDRLRESGFRSVDCFWRCDCDAVYGGIKGDASVVESP